MSKIKDRIGCRYDDILAYFEQRPFGSYPPDMTVLSGLPPVDRCLILEQVYLRGFCDVLALIDKLSMAYLKAGWKNIALEFLDSAYRRRLMPYDAYLYFQDKIEGLSSVRLSSKTYAESVATISGDRCMSPELCDMLLDLCQDYREQNVFEGVDFTSALDAPDVRDFIEERRSFVRLVAVG